MKYKDIAIGDRFYVKDRQHKYPNRYFKTTKGSFAIESQKTQTGYFRRFKPNQEVYIMVFR